MKNNIGGKRIGAGRKPKATEIELIELLTPLDSIAFKALEKGVNAGEFPYIKLYFEYRYGKPKQQMDINQTQEDRFDLSVLTDEELKTYSELTEKITIEDGNIGLRSWTINVVSPKE